MLYVYANHNKVLKKLVMSYLKYTPCLMSMQTTTRSWRRDKLVMSCLKDAEMYTCVIGWASALLRLGRTLLEYLSLVTILE